MTYLYGTISLMYAGLVVLGDGDTANVSLRLLAAFAWAALATLEAFAPRLYKAALKAAR